MIVKRASRPGLYVELLSGQKIYFKGETEGQRALRGLHVDIIAINKFEMPWAESEE